MRTVQHRITYYLSIALLLLLALLFLLMEKSGFSSLENRSLASFPQISMEGLIDGSNTKQIDSFIEDHFPLRTAFVKINAVLETLFRRSEKNDVIIGKSGYLFERSEDSQKNIAFNLEAIRDFAEHRQVYLMIVPNSSLIYSAYLPQGYPLVSAYQTILDYPMENVTKVPLLSNFLEHKAEKLYYRTDHHWTAVGAELAYQTLMRLWNKESQTLTMQSASPFLGSYYAKTLTTRTTPEEFSYWVNPAATYMMDGREATWIDEKKLASNDKYAALLQGNPARAQVKGSGQGKLLLFKDSFANAIVPLLAQNFAQIEIIDLRYYADDVQALTKELNADRILFLYGERSISKERSIGFALTNKR